MSKPAQRRGVSGNPAKRYAPPVEEVVEPSRTERFFALRWVQYAMILLVLAGSFGPIFATLITTLRPSADRDWTSAVFFSVLLTSFFLYIATYLVDAVTRWRMRRSGRVAVEQSGRTLQKLVLVVAAFAILVGLALGSYAQLNASTTPVDQGQNDAPDTGIPLFPSAGQE